jgi:hypothetical protein
VKTITTYNVKVFSNFVLSLQLQDNILPARKGTGTGF